MTSEQYFEFMLHPTTFKKKQSMVWDIMSRKTSYKYNYSFTILPISL